MASADGRAAQLDLPVKRFPGWEAGVRFMPAYPGDPEIIEIAAGQTVQAKDCPNVFRSVEQSPSRCRRAGVVAGVPVYTIRRQAVSLNIQAYTERAGTLIAVTGLHSAKEALTYLERFTVVPRRDVSDLLQQHRAVVQAAATAIKQEKTEAAEQRLAAYRYLQFDPVLPATLPAGWLQYSVLLSGESAGSPNRADILYKKGRGRFIGMTLVPRATATLGNTCGPVPDTGAGVVACQSVPNEPYYLGGINAADHITRYVYVPLGEVVAILQTSVHSDTGLPLLFDENVLAAQLSIAKSLRAASRDQLAGAVFVGAQHDPYPAIEP